MKTFLNFFRTAAVTVACLAAMSGCATRHPAGTGATVRAIMASQVVPAQPRPERGTDAAAAMAGYANYQRSYVTPTPQGDSAMIGSGLGGK
ncbi:hypothetical protein [Pseudoduganella lutea]|uniref:Lipoprotein n=1 Tax=Pseudoduganella lutea TaxID=321985 RepID=A0A4P6KU45_9BURK|nr:hypothetical protein [Pseudoduganella lutea]QBE62214.1 hypothetical protein EWM63_03800 [Pseudoduganella lutea]